MKKTILFFLIFIMIFSMFVLPASADDGITIYVNNEILNCDIPPFIENGRTMVPLRKIFDAFDVSIEWLEESKQIVITQDKREIVFQINKPSMICDRYKTNLDVAPVIVNGSTFVPLRAISESLDADVEWISVTKTIYINSYEAYTKAMDNLPPTVTMCSLDGRELEVFESEIQEYEKVGWYWGFPETMYALDGRTLTVGEFRIPEYEAVGWYWGAPATMYSSDGRTLTVGENRVYEYEEVGWYWGEPITLTSKDGESKVVGKDRFRTYHSAYQELGYYYGSPITLYKNGEPVTIGDKDTEAINKYKADGYSETYSPGSAPKGKKVKPCTYPGCNGGKRDCNHCGGDGKVTEYNIRLHKIVSKSCTYAACVFGKLTCHKCGGSGWITVEE